VVITPLDEEEFTRGCGQRTPQMAENATEWLDYLPASGYGARAVITLP
jgi:hypothetical protein